jgi:hypothetical protein
MRVAIVGLLTALSLVSASAVEMKTKRPVCAGEMSTEYPCEWQRKLMIAQREFAANLEAVDETTTGSITQTDR